MTVATAQNVTSLQLTGAVLIVNAPLSVSNLLWSGGTLQGSSRTTVNTAQIPAGTFSVLLNGHRVSFLTLLTWNGGTLQLQSSATFTVLGKCIISFNGLLSVTSNVPLSNFTVAGFGTLALQSPLNMGAQFVLQQNATCQFTPASAATLSILGSAFIAGTVNMSSTATLALSGTTVSFVSGARFIGPANVLVSGGKTTFSTIVSPLPPPIVVDPAVLGCVSLLQSQFCKPPRSFSSFACCVSCSIPCFQILPRRSSRKHSLLPIKRPATTSKR